MRRGSATRPTHRWLGLWALAVALGACQETVAFQVVNGDGGNGNDAGGPPGNFCSGGQARDLVPTMESPDVIIALDRSSEMSTPFGSTTHLDAARQVLGTTVMTYQAVVRFGSIQFPGSAMSCFDPAGCCPGLVNFPTLSGYNAFKSDLAMCDSPTAGCADTAQRPTAAALDGCLQVFSRFEQGVPGRYVLLVTDGPPGCANNGGSGACRDAVSEVSMLTNLGVNTVVVGLGDPAPDDCLSEMAQKAGNRFNNPFYASSPAELTSTIASLVRKMATDACTLDLKSAPDDPTRVALFQDGVEVPRNDPNGWSFDNSPYRITLSGKACDTLLELGMPSTSVYACDTRPPPH